MVLHLVNQVAELLAQQPPPTNGGGPDFSHIKPNSNAVPKSGIFYTMAEVLLYTGLGVLFLVLISGLIMWGGGSLFKNTGWSEDAKSRIFKAGLGAIAVTAAGALWTWIIAL